MIAISKGNSRGRGGISYLIPLTTLPAAIQKTFWRNQDATVNAQDDVVPGITNVNQRINTVTELITKYGEQRSKNILAEPRRREKIVLEALEVYHRNSEKTKHMELIAQKNKVTKETLYRWVRKYKAEGFIGLVHDKYREPGNGLKAKKRRSVNNEMFNFIMAMFLREMQPKGSHILRELKKAAAIKGWKVPSRATLYRVIREVSQSEVVRARKGKQQWEHKIKPKTSRTYNNLMVMQEIVGDGHKFDAFVEYMGRAVRAETSVWVDLRSRKIIGWCVTPQANAESIGLALKNSIETHGLPGCLYTDNGKDYLSKYVEAVCIDLGIGIRHCIPKTPQAKLIERTFREVHDKFTRYQVGYCGNKPGNRPEGFNQTKLLKDGKLKSLKQFAVEFGAWVEEYNNSVHGALKETPAQAFDANEHFRPGFVDKKVLQVLFMKRERVKVHPGYIRLLGRDFWTFGTKIDWLIGKYVDVWYDFNNMGQVLIWYNGKIIGTAENKKVLEHGESRAELAAEQRAKAKFARETKQRIDAYAQRLSDDLDVILPQDVLKRKHSRDRYVTGRADGQIGYNVSLLTGHEKDAEKAVEALAEKDDKRTGVKQIKMGRARRMLLEEGKRALSK